MMSDATNTGMSRRKLLEAVGAAAAAAASTPEPVPFKATAKGAFTGLLIPQSPPIASAHVSLKGEASDMGPVEYVEAHIGHLGIDGQFRTFTDAQGAMTNASGDALFFTASGSVHASATGEILGDGAFFTITGGRGKFCGAAGSGTVTSRANLAAGEITYTWDGMIQMPPK